jgi:hypothetical protein
MKSFLLFSILVASTTFASSNAPLLAREEQPGVQTKRAGIGALMSEAGQARRAADMAFAVGNDIEGKDHARRAAFLLAEAIADIEIAQERTRKEAGLKSPSILGAQNSSAEVKTESRFRQTLASMKVSRAEVLGEQLGEYEAAELELAEAVGLDPEQLDYRKKLDRASARTARLRGEKQDRPDALPTILQIPTPPSDEVRRKSQEAKQRALEIEAGKN